MLFWGVDQFSICFDVIKAVFSTKQVKFKETFLIFQLLIASVLGTTAKQATNLVK